MPTWVQLQYALEVEKQRHFGKASRACHVTQPTLSQQLQKLEDEVGIILFDRTKKPILPTPEGQKFLEQARVVMREQKKLLHVARQTQTGELAGDFKLGVIPTVASDLLPGFLRAFSKAHPKIRLFIEEMKTDVILDELVGDRLDGAILATPIEGVDFKVHPLYYERFYVYFSGDHPLLKHSKIERRQLDAAEMWLLQDGHCFKDQVVNFCASPRTEGASANIQFRSGSLDTLKRMVQLGNGYTLIPEMMALSLKKPERDAHVRGFQTPAPAREISLIYRRDHWKLAILKAIEETVARTLPDEISRTPEKNVKILEVG